MGARGTHVRRRCWWLAATCTAGVIGCEDASHDTPDAWRNEEGFLAPVASAPRTTGLAPAAPPPNSSAPSPRPPSSAPVTVDCETIAPPPYADEPLTTRGMADEVATWRAKLASLCAVPGCAGSSWRTEASQKAADAASAKLRESGWIQAPPARTAHEIARLEMFDGLVQCAAGHERGASHASTANARLSGTGYRLESPAPCVFELVTPAGREPPRGADDLHLEPDDPLVSHPFPRNAVRPRHSGQGPLRDAIEADLAALATMEPDAQVWSTLHHAWGFDVRAVPHLVRWLDHPASAARSFAARTLGQIGPEASLAAPRLVALLDDPDEQVAHSAAFACGRLGAPEAVEPLVRLLTSGGWASKLFAAHALGRLGTPAEPALPALDEVAAAPPGLEGRLLALTARRSARWIRERRPAP